jgi:hypothetical protein
MGNGGYTQETFRTVRARAWTIRDWLAAKSGDEYSKDAVWFRQWIEVRKQLHGYDLTGTKIWFNFQATHTRFWRYVSTIQRRRNDGNGPVGVIP